MAGLVKISEAASMALHTMVLLASNPDRTMRSREINGVIGGSENHLSKVLQRLSKAGLVKSTRGPAGGFTLARNPEDITLLGVYEAIDGPLDETGCLLGQPICKGQCILGGFLHDVDRQAREYLSEKTLSEFTNVFKGGPDAC